MKGTLRDQRGFTTAELLLASMFGLIVMASLYSFYREQLFHLLVQETKTATMEDARGALDLMVRELRNAGAWTKSPYTAPSGCSRVAVATTTKISIRADLDADGDCDGDVVGEYIEYELSGSDIKRKVTSSGSAATVISNVEVPSGSDFLTYYDAAGATTATAADVKRVKITFQVKVPNPSPLTMSTHVSSTLSSSVEFRNP